MIYSISATVYAKKYGILAGRTVHTNIEASNDDEAKVLAIEKFKNYCAALKRHHNNDFEFTNVNIRSCKEQ